MYLYLQDFMAPKTDVALSPAKAPRLKKNAPAQKVIYTYTSKTPLLPVDAPSGSSWY